MSTIKCIFGHEPMREREYPTAYIVGRVAAGYTRIVSKIVRRDDNFGDHGIGWYDVFTEIDGEAVLMASMSARAVSEIHWDVDE